MCVYTNAAAPLAMKRAREDDDDAGSAINTHVTGGEPHGGEAGRGGAGVVASEGSEVPTARPGEPAACIKPAFAACCRADSTVPWLCTVLSCSFSDDPSLAANAITNKGSDCARRRSCQSATRQSRRQRVRGMPCTTIVSCRMLTLG